ncbi:MAG: aminopeptidase N [Xanthobacteraceae bacterium]|jgi:aminopeptidase N
MRTEQARPIRLVDYRPPDWLVETVELDVSLHPTQTRVRATLALKPNPQAEAPAPLMLDGDELQLTSLKLDGQPLAADAYSATPDGLTIPQPPQRNFVLEIETVTNPSANTQLMGLFRSSGTYCTQCEAEGFRRITYFPDRPDVMAIYTTRIEADRDEAPILLANGNLVEHGEIAGTNRHFATWFDPFRKPSYLFAMVGGRLGVIEDTFVTQTGRRVALRIYVEPGKEERAGYAMDSLKRAMGWDEEAFGLMYDLDVFMIVAVSDFNMGAMENKGLNIFNDKYVLASAQSATDADYAGVEGVIAHEYFHNWTGDRITCRDWFQLCLKEGLTVFRDQEFTSDQRSRPVKRISDVRALRAQQFVEDAGPLAHPVRPEVYHEISNFYTATVYEKGAEVVRMLKVLLGADDFRRGMNLYFMRHDGEAVTIEDFVQCFADAAKIDLAQFLRWYRQAGTPEVRVISDYDQDTQTYRLDITQTTPPTPGQPTKQPLTIPLAIALLDPQGRELPLRLADGSIPARGVLVLKQPSETFVFTGIAQRPVASLNRGFSAPIKLATERLPQELRFLAAHDTDPFNRWEALQTLATGVLINNATKQHDTTERDDGGLLAALKAVVEDESLEPAFAALTLTLPSEADVAREIGHDVDPDAIFRERTGLRGIAGRVLASSLWNTYLRLSSEAPYSPDAASAGRRALRNTCLDLLVATGDPTARALAMRQFETADNMTDRLAALACLSLQQTTEREQALEAFYQQFQSDALVIDKWLMLQAAIPEAGTLDRVRGLTTHKAFSFANPNRVRSLIGAFAHGNQTQFNRADGAGYEFVADCVLSLDPKNPQVAARLMTAFRSWRALEPGRRARAEAALRRVAASGALSRDVRDIVERSLAG